MARVNNKAKLPDNPTLKDINWYKKQLNWGELPPFYHLVASSVSESDGLFQHGFDNAVTRLVDKRNWNLALLDGYEDDNGNIFCENKPKIAIDQVFTDRGFELWALPYAKDKPLETDMLIKDNKFLEFNTWDPHAMKTLLRFNQLHKFIAFYFERGDVADKALILHSHKVVHKIITYLKKEMNVVTVKGVSIKEFYQLCEKDSRMCSDEIDLAQIMLGLSGNKE
ncbi:hypothetical protein AAEU28_02690 [Pseudoalteromonas sp. SS15]|uniref:hypothetical protein n=1 Tax=Pseudoalteromonas sp. SS15 TaxID=3139393 RepID=UPI003BA8599F